MFGGLGSVLGAVGGGVLGGLSGSQPESFSGLDPRFSGSADRAVGLIDVATAGNYYAPSNAMIDGSATAGFDTGQRVTDLANRTLGGEFADIANNQYAQNAINAGTSQVARDFLERTLPGLESAAIQQGAFGGSRNAIVNLLAAERANAQAQERASQIANQFYQAERERMMQAGQLGQQGAGLQLTAGQTQQQQADRQLQNPYMRAEFAAQQLGSPAFRISESKGDVFGGILQGVLGGAAAGGLIGDGLGGLFGGGAATTVPTGPANPGPNYNTI